MLIFFILSDILKMEIGGTMKLTKEQIKKFINEYGNDDLYYRHHYEGKNNEIIVVHFIPHIGKFMSEQFFDETIKELEKKNKIEECLKTLIITNRGARIVSNDAWDRTLEKSYHKFLQDLYDDNQIEM